MVEKTMSYTSTFKEYLTLTKPGIVTLVLITTLGGAYIGSGGFWTGTSTASWRELPQDLSQGGW